MRRTIFRYPVTSLAGSTPGNILCLLKNHKTERKYYLKIFLSFLVAVIFSPLNWIENLVWGKRIKNFHFEEPPVFIIGFMRSGTTLLHNLLCRDPKAGYTTTFQTVFPHCVLTQKWWLKPFTNRFLPEKRPFDNVSMDMDFPQEEEFGLSNLQPYSVYNFFLFPSEFNSILEQEYLTASLPEKQLDFWKKKYRQLVVKSLLNTKGIRYISKNPHNIPRMELLREMFPGCRFIFIYRDPYFVVESLYHFVLSIFPGVQLQEIPEIFSREHIARFYSVAMKQYFENRDKIGAPAVLEIKMEDFVKDVTGGLRAIYSAFHLNGFETNIPAFQDCLSRNPDNHKDAYKIHGDTVRYVNLYASEIVKKLGYPLRAVGQDQL